MDRANHYESAFAGFLRQQKLGYIAVNEARRSLVDGESVKSLDFIVYGPSGSGLLVDVKGRRFPGVSAGPTRRVWECWVSADDLAGLRRWVGRFGNGYVGLFAFVYQIMDGVAPGAGPWESWTHRGKQYQLRAVALNDYERWVRTRSTSWCTVDLPASAFREVARTFLSFLRTDSAEASELCPTTGASS